MNALAQSYNHTNAPEYICYNASKQPFDIDASNQIFFARLLGCLFHCDLLEGSQTVEVVLQLMLRWPNTTQNMQKALMAWTPRHKLASYQHAAQVTAPTDLACWRYPSVLALVAANAGLAYLLKPVTTNVIVKIWQTGSWSSNWRAHHFSCVFQYVRQLIRLHLVKETRSVRPLCWSTAQETWTAPTTSSPRKSAIRPMVSSGCRRRCWYLFHWNCTVTWEKTELNTGVLEKRKENKPN